MGDTKAICIARTVPEGKKLFEFDFTYKQFKNIILTSDDNYFVAYGYDKLKDTIFVNHAVTGEFLHKILVKYPNFKEVTMICGLPDKPWQVSLQLINTYLKPKAIIAGITENPATQFFYYSFFH